jgi:predicted nucleic acid-binding protein
MPSATAYQMDANILLRFLHHDHKDHSARATKLIERANNGEIVLHVSAVTVAEIFYAMKSSYNIDRRRTALILAGVLNTPAFSLAEHDRILDALARVASTNVDFGDAYIAATGADTQTAIASFDRDLDKFADVKRHEP